MVFRVHETPILLNSSLIDLSDFGTVLGSDFFSPTPPPPPKNGLRSRFGPAGVIWGAWVIVLELDGIILDA